MQHKTSDSWQFQLYLQSDCLSSTLVGLQMAFSFYDGRGREPPPSPELAGHPQQVQAQGKVTPQSPRPPYHPLHVQVQGRIPAPSPKLPSHPCMMPSPGSPLSPMLGPSIPTWSYHPRLHSPGRSTCQMVPRISPVLASPSRLAYQPGILVPASPARSKRSLILP